MLPDETVIQAKSITLSERKVYKQDWPKYKLAQAIEKRRLRVLLHDLCRNLAECDSPATRPGPKAHLVRDCIVSMAYESPFPACRMCQ
jgi:hypothetical protein